MNSVFCDLRSTCTANPVTCLYVWFIHRLHFSASFVSPHDAGLCRCLIRSVFIFFQSFLDPHAPVHIAAPHQRVLSHALISCVHPCPGSAHNVQLLAGPAVIVQNQHRKSDLFHFHPSLLPQFGQHFAFFAGIMNALNVVAHSSQVAQYLLCISAFTGSSPIMLLASFSISMK